MARRREEVHAMLTLTSPTVAVRRRSPQHAAGVGRDVLELVLGLWLQQLRGRGARHLPVNDPPWVSIGQDTGGDGKQRPQARGYRISRRDGRSAAGAPSPRSL